jgi:hypothetical protein
MPSDREALLFVDHTKFVFAVAGGTLQEPGWEAVVREATVAFTKAAEQVRPTLHGKFTSISAGIVHTEKVSL